MKKAYIGIIVLLFAAMACNQFGNPLWPEGDPHWTPQPIVVPCNDYLPADNPHYVQGWNEIDGPVEPTGWVIGVGPYTDTIFPGQESELDFKLSLLMNAYLPQYQTEVFSKEDATRVATFTMGTDASQQFNFNVYIQLSNAKYFFAFTKRGFYLGGAVTKDEFVSLAEKYRSMIGVNFRDIVTDSSGERQCMLAVLDSCKDGTNKTVNFKFNHFEEGDSIVTAYTDAGWTVYNPFTGPISGEARSSGKVIGVIRNGVLDARGYKISKEDIIATLKQGIPVITDL